MSTLQQELEAARKEFEDKERDILVRALALGSRTDAALALGIGLRTLFYKIRKYGLGD